MEEVLVIGGAGFVGSHLVRMLRENGNRVRSCSGSAGKGRKPAPGIRYIGGAISDAQAVAVDVEGVKVVYGVAAQPVGTWEEIRRAYGDGCRNVAEACLRHRVRRLVYASTTAALDWGLTATIDESAGTDKKAHLRPGYYHISKIAAETLLMEMHDRSGLPVVILRPGIVVGRGGVLCHAGICAWRSRTCCTIVRQPRRISAGSRSPISRHSSARRSIRTSGQFIRRTCGSRGRSTGTGAPPALSHSPDCRTFSAAMAALRRAEICGNSTRQK